MGRLESFALFFAFSLLFLIIWPYFLPPETYHDRSITFRLAKDYFTQIRSQGLNIYVENAPKYLPSKTLLTRPTSVFKPRSVEAFMQARFSNEDISIIWDEVQVDGPDIEDRHTLQQLAMMSGNAYALPGQKNWYDLDGAWNEVGPI